MSVTKHVITITVKETAELTRDVEVTLDELKKILENDSPVLDEIFEEVDYENDACREFNYTVNFNGAAISDPSECFPEEEEERSYLEKIRAAFDEVSGILSDNLPDAYFTGSEEEKYARECQERTDQAVRSFNDAYAKLAELLNAVAERGN